MCHLYDFILRMYVRTAALGGVCERFLGGGCVFACHSRAKGDILYIYGIHFWGPRVFVFPLRARGDILYIYIINIFYQKRESERYYISRKRYITMTTRYRDQ